MISKLLMLNLIFHGIDARKCHSVKMHQLQLSCSVCNQLIHLDLLATQGSRVKAACVTLSRNQCCGHQNLSQDSLPWHLNGHMFHYLALVWVMLHQLESPAGKHQIWNLLTNTQIKQFLVNIIFVSIVILSERVTDVAILITVIFSEITVIFIHWLKCIF